MTMKFNNSIAVLQPQIPHFRTEFYKTLRECIFNLDIYVYNSIKKSEQQGFQIDCTNLHNISNLHYKGILWYNPCPLLQKKYDTLVLMWHFAHITTWLLLLTKFIHRKKIILWGQGISVKRYLKEENNPNVLLRWMLALADGAWVYMEKETKEWQKVFPEKKIVALNNTLSGTNEMLKCQAFYNKDELKRKYNINEKYIFIFCARFTNPYRRTDFLLKAIESLNKELFGFVIIGAGIHKPDFSDYSNVYDFGAQYDMNLKQELFSLADLYFQPGWVGLSIVEAMAYGKPVCTFMRSNKTLQCVEYSYIEDGVNGMIFSDMDDFLTKMLKINDDDINRMGKNAKLLVEEKLNIYNMTKNACSILDQSEF